MNDDESKAEEYLKSEGYSNIIFEPDGNVPPDFIVNNSIAIEVRRLNKNIITSLKDNPENIEHLHYRLLPIMNDLINKYSSKDVKNSSLVIINYSRPLKLKKKLFQEIDNILDKQLSFIDENRSYLVNKNLTLKFIPLPKKVNKTYISGSIDRDSGGMLLTDMYDNLNLIIEEKDRKIRPYFKNYKHWWLILVDYISFGLEDKEIEELNQILTLDTIFERIIIITPENPMIGKIINKAST